MKTLCTVLLVLAATFVGCGRGSALQNATSGTTQAPPVVYPLNMQKGDFAFAKLAPDRTAACMSVMDLYDFTAGKVLSLTTEGAIGVRA